MAGSKSAYYEKKILDFTLAGVAYTPPGVLYLALSTVAFTVNATGTVMNEVSTSGTAYARLPITCNTTNWPVSTGSGPASISNGVVLTFATATASWGTILSAYLCDASTAGNVLYGSDLTTPKLIANGDTATYAIGSLTITEL